MKASSRLTCLFSAVSLAGLALTACGGGGSSSAAPAPAPVAAAPSPALGPAYSTRLAVTSVPTPTYSSTSPELAAFNHLNAIRGSLGLGLFTQSASLDGAAAAHSNYVKINGSGNGHFETAGLPGFTGVNPGDRLIASGYTATGGAEDIGFTGGGVATIDNLVDSVYHRIPMLQYKIRDIGIGFLQTSPNQSDPAFNTYVAVFDMAYSGTGQGAPAQTTIVWPADNSTTTSVSMTPESPRPGTPGSSGVFGYPVSISTDEDRILTATSFTLTDNTGASVLCNLLSYATDSNLVTFNAKAFVALVPRDPLRAASTYTVQFVGTLDGAAYSRTWSFKTP